MPSMTTTAPTRVDRYPARVEYGDTVLKSARAYYDGSTLQVFQATPLGIKRRFVGTVVEFTRSRHSMKPDIFKLEDGSVVGVFRGRGCGCSSPLKRFNPSTFEAGE